MKLILASNNQKKLREMREILSGLDVEVISQREAGIDVEAEETGETFEENALIKARAAAELSSLPCVADDSGLEVDALGGEPGVHSARYSGSHDDTDEARYGLLLKKLGNEEHRAARFVSCVCCFFPDGGVITARGECSGVILTAPRGDGGFGYDPVFMPDALPGRSMAELSPAEKNSISHRGKALEQFKAALRGRLQQPR